MLEQAPLVWAEIAVTDMRRATSFYQEHFGVSFQMEDIADMEMAILQTKDPKAASIGLVKHEMMKPSLDGSIVYLYLSESLGPVVDKLNKAKVRILMPPMPIKDGEIGYMAIFVDSEGNKVGLWSPAA